MERSPTMVDVAREAGVALRTVSRHVNGQTNIAPELAQRIQAAIDRLGYRRNLAAASIRPGRSSRVLGLVIGDIGNPFYSALARAIEQVTSPASYLLMTVSSEEDGERHDELVDRLIEHRVDGLLIVPPHSAGRPWDEAGAAHRPPLVFVDRPGTASRADSVIADNAGGSRRAVEELLAHGARRIAFLGDTLDIYTMTERLRGYREALEAFGIASDPSLIHGDVHDGEDGARVVRELLAKGAADAVFAANNRASVGAVLGFARAGERLPLIGFDDFESATLVTPQASVVEQDIPTMGRAAAERLIARIEGDDSPPQRLVLPTRLVLRGSER